MQNKAMVFAGISGCLAVILGAFGAHSLGDKGLLNPKDMHAYETGVMYQLIHTLALMGVFMAKDKLPLYNRAVTNLFMAGIICFSGSLYLVSTSGVTGIDFKSWLWPITPLGGVLFIVGWGLLAVSAIKYKQEAKQ